MQTENPLQNAYIGEYVEGRQPGASTLAYWELNGNSNDTKNDYGVQTYTATDYDSTGYSGAGNPSYVSLSGGKQCAYFDGTRLLKGHNIGEHYTNKGPSSKLL